MAFWHHFRAFDTEISLCIISDGKKPDKLFSAIEKSALNFQKRFSRFDPQSELNKINQKKKNTIKISRAMADLLQAAKLAYQKTQGIFDPSILSTLQALGYDQSFDLLTTKPASLHQAGQSPSLKKSFQKFQIDLKELRLTSPTGSLIDLGGIAKGYWVDQARKILDQNYQNYWLSAGGDLFIKGHDEDGQSWEVNVQNPLNLELNMTSLDIPAAGFGIATSGITKRNGLKSGQKWHHLIDPRKNRPVRNSILSVTVVANSTTEADIMAKTILILGIKKGLEIVNQDKNLHCLIIDKNLRMHLSRNFKNFL